MQHNNNSRLKIYLSVFVALLLIGITGFVFIEKFSLIDAIYFSIVTMSTVGYGDIHPQTDIGKLLALMLIIGGVGTFLGVIANITDFFVNRREEALRQQKLNILTGLFFSEMGSELLKRFTALDPEIKTLHKTFNISEKWKHENFDTAYNILKKHSHIIESRRCNLFALREYLENKGNLLLRLIENPVIQEYEHFTDLLRSIFHLRDELLHRKDLAELSNTDRKHLENDIIRVYNLLIFEWLRYIQCMQNNYKYLFSLAVRTNPFDPKADAAC
jgi:voltage-gated potassium channel